MPDIQKILNEHIRKLAKQEIKTALSPILERMAEMRKTINLQAKEIRDLRKCPVPLEEPQLPKPELLPKPRRISKERITGLRMKLQLTRVAFARLLDVSPVSVASWERGNTTPRAKQMAKIAEVRDMDKNTLKKLFEGKGLEVIPVVSQNTASVSSFKDKLLAFRTAHGLSQAQLALLLGVSKGSICNWEAGRSSPRTAQEAKIEALPSLSTDEIKTRLSEPAE